MITARSSFKISRALPVYKNLLKRSIGTMVFYGALMFIFLPLQYIMELAKYYEHNMVPMPRWNLMGPAQMYNEVSLLFFIMIAVMAPVIVTTGCFSYMHNKRSTDVYHALPLTRDELYVVHSAVSATVICIPLIVNFSIVALASMASPAKNAGAIMTELLCWIAVTLVMVAITAFAAVESGTSFDTAIFSIGLNVSLIAVYFTVLMIGEMMLYGFSLSEPAAEFGYKLSPVAVIIARQGINDLFGYETGVLAGNNIAVMLWLLAGIGIFIAGMMIYRKRPSENAEMVGNMSFVQVYLRSAGTLVVGTMLGAMFCGVFEYEGDTAMLIATFIGSVITYFIGDALLSRNIRALPKALPKAVITSAGVAAIMLVMIFGGLGYESRVPAADSVEKITLRYYQGRFENQPNINYRYRDGNVFESREAVQLILDAHAAQCKAEDTTDDMAYHQTSLNIEYDLKNGEMHRAYNGVCFETYDALLKLESDPEFITKNHPIYKITSDQIDKVAVYNAIGTRNKQLTLSEQQKQQLLEAVQADLLTQPASEFEGGTKAQGYLSIEIKYLPKSYYNDDGAYVIVEESTRGVDEKEYRYTTSEILITDSYKNTIALLKNAGASDCLENDFSEVKYGFIGVAGYQISGMGNAVCETNWNDIGVLDDDIFYHQREYGVFDDENWGYIHITAEQLKAAENQLSSIITPYRESHIIVATVIEKDGKEQIGGYYFAPLSAFDMETIDRMLENAEQCYGVEMVERLRVAFG